MAALRQLLWTHAGIVRNADGLAAALQQLADWTRVLPTAVTREERERANMLLVGSLLVEAALARRESRGAHARTDYPALSDSWRCHLVFRSGTSGALDGAVSNGRALQLSGAGVQPPSSRPQTVGTH
jgi:L-aspartate oxidase